MEVCHCLGVLGPEIVGHQTKEDRHAATDHYDPERAELTAL